MRSKAAFSTALLTQSGKQAAAVMALLGCTGYTGPIGEFTAFEGGTGTAQAVFGGKFI